MWGLREYVWTLSLAKVPELGFLNFIAPQQLVVISEKHANEMNMKRGQCHEFT